MDLVRPISVGHHFRMSQAWEILESPLLREVNSQKRSAVKQAIPEFSTSPVRHLLSAWRYLSTRPYCFYSRIVHAQYFDWLVSCNTHDEAALKLYISENLEELDRALAHLEEINRFTWHDDLLGNDELAGVRFIDQNVNPTYLRLVEAVLFPFIRVVAYFSRLSRGKGTEGLELWSVREEVSTGPMRCAIESYRHTIRNGIGHGGVTYLESSIRYRDKKGNEETLDIRSLLRLFDDLLDTCNGLALGLHAFLLTQQPEDYPWPRSLLIEELRAETKLTWWEVSGCIPAVRSKSSQLIIYAESATSDIDKVRFSAFSTAIFAEQFAPGFDRYFISIRSKKALPGFVGFDGAQLARVRRKPDAVVEDFKGVLENDLLFFIPHIKPIKIFRTLETWFAIARYQFEASAIAKRDRLSTDVRVASVHRNSWGSVLEGRVVLSTKEREITAHDVVSSRRKLVLRSLAEARRELPWYKLEKYLPLGYARIFVFRTNYRRRRLSGYGLGEDLVCTVQVQRIRRIKSPDIYQSKVETYGRYRIAWNKDWLSANGAQQHVYGLPPQGLELT